MRKMSIIFTVLLILLLSGCGFGSYLETGASGGGSQEEILRSTEDGETAQPVSDVCYVQVSGAVNAPGVYEMEQGSRVCHAIERAGGLRADAWDKDLNQAQPVEDGQKIYVACVEEMQTDSGAGADGPSSREDGKVNLNTADAAALMTLPGIGQSKADLIISYREEHGRFQVPEDIMKIQGIKEGVYNKIADMITVY